MIVSYVKRRADAATK